MRTNPISRSTVRAVENDVRRGVDLRILMQDRHRPVDRASAYPERAGSCYRTRTQPQQEGPRGYPRNRTYENDVVATQSM